MYGIRVALPLAAVWGTSRSTQIAGAGYTAAAWQERTVTLLITSGFAPLIVATMLWLYGLFNNPATPPARGRKFDLSRRAAPIAHSVADHSGEYGEPLTRRSLRDLQIPQ
jgi:hypothetical protein